ncbi:sigma-54-dependent transcriptional regulator [Chitinophaga pinensis]|uniref:Two component, sigma54 specific, transcriptional regulator, Fis family n=1 Tax=Chitinophaga pinensis (strain ATCC 43595 / DSM 2588 / LMG 13176 / NBRC 15968 / NCIMB 11800 / UQM 2034) TaxID=485918 RepID=A0A979GR90_CHIPD|nr:sigma-54 dependent transcriptional regulator [Chitinophaga pinensis]ACU62152.1 two component, sigma54 specific, transcriptional regulator, Fis family [Chitinophaga pinensis DSM 2588]
MKTILIVDDEIQICTLLTKILTKEGYDVSHSVSGSSALKMVKEKHYDVIFCDYRLKDKEIDGSVLSLKIREISPATGIIVMTGYPDVRVAIQLIKGGIYDYVVKPLNAEQAILLVQKVLLHQSLHSKEQLPAATIASETPVSTLVSPKGRLSQFVYGNGNSSKELHVQIKLIAPTNYSVVILGETGTGKESVAHLIHSQSKRKDQPFVAIDCGSLSPELACSELFGHEKGAFTGAIQAKTGAFHEAHGGTLFLDEIGNLSYEVQTALLRVIQERVVRPVGSTKETKVDIRLIVASNEDLQHAVLNGRFRDDLYYRLNEFTVNVPPLRARKDDLPLFIATFKQTIEAELGRECGEITEEVYHAFYNYCWPGNIRELKNVMRRICLLATDNSLITSANLPEELLPQDVEPGLPPGSDENLKNVSRQAEYKKILDVLQQVRFNKSEAARLMNIDRKTLYNKLHTLNIVL